MKITIYDWSIRPSDLDLDGVAYYPSEVSITNILVWAESIAIPRLAVLPMAMSHAYLRSAADQADEEDDIFMYLNSLDGYAGHILAFLNEVFDG